MFIPGRIEFLGKHTDYCGGRSIVCAIDRGFHAEIEPRTDSEVVLTNRDTNETVSLRISDPHTKPWHWSKYAAEVISRLRKNFGASRKLNGVNISFHSDLPRASGISSSSALMILVFAAIGAANDLTAKDEFRTNITSGSELAEYLGCVENGQSFKGLNGSSGVGTFGGSQDHAAILLSKAGSLRTFSFAPLNEEAVIKFPADHSFVIASSGVTAAKTGAARDRYNRVALAARAAAKASGITGSLKYVIDEIGIDELRDRISNSVSEFPAGELLRRVEQFYRETYEIIPMVGEMLQTNKLDGIGELIDDSQKNAERLLGNQVEETVYLQYLAREIGAVCSSAFGAGFGGSVYAMVKTTDAGKFLSEWRHKYLSKYPKRTARSAFLVTYPSQADLRPFATDFGAFP
jgi:galactokinase